MGKKNYKRKGGTTRMNNKNLNKTNEVSKTTKVSEYCKPSAKSIYDILSIVMQASAPISYKDISDQVTVCPEYIESILKDFVEVVSDGIIPNADFIKVMKYGREVTSKLSAKSLLTVSIMTVLDSEESPSLDSSQALVDCGITTVSQLYFLKYYLRVALSVDIPELAITTPVTSLIATICKIQAEYAEEEKAACNG